MRVETKAIEPEGWASAKVPRKDHSWLVPGPDRRPVNLESGMHGGRRYEMKSEREAELDYTRKMLMPLCDYVK